VQADQKQPVNFGEERNAVFYGVWEIGVGIRKNPDQESAMPLTAYGQLLEAGSAQLTVFYHGKTSSDWRINLTGCPSRNDIFFLAKGIYY